jgi:chromosome segregation ATPase
MLNNLKLIMWTAAAMLLVFVGYQIGARKVDKLEAQIESIRVAASEAEAKLSKSREDIARALKDKDAEYAGQARKLKAESDRNAKELAAALASANIRIKSLQVQANGLDAKRARLTADMDAASQAERRKLQDEIAALDRDRKTLMAKAAANECLAAVVPEQAVGPLVRRN